MKKARFALLQSVLCLLLCVSMLVGTTFAWLTDGISSGVNMIAAGSLDVVLEYLDENGTWTEVDADTHVLDEDALWEPGHCEVVYLRVSNGGALALKYSLGVGILAETGSVNAAGEEFKLSDHIRFGVVETTDPVTYASRNAAIAALPESKPISAGYSSSYSLKEAGEMRYATLVVYMPESVGNAANYATGENPPEIQLGIQLVATQEVHETDSFGDDYDTNATMPGFDFPDNVFGENTSSGVETDSENKLTEELTLQGENTNAIVPAGVQVEAGVEELTLEVTSMSQSLANVTLGENDAMRSLNVHVQGVAANNTQPITITIKEAAAKGLNSTSIKLYHVENGQTLEMTPVDTFTAHNQFMYDPVTGDVTLYMATFSEVAVVADTVNAWEGGFDYSWYVTRSADYIIANAEQLAAFGAIVGGMNGQTQDSFTGKTVNLVNNVNLGYGSENYHIFYPIGYYNSTGSYEKTSGGSVTSSVSSFEGTFDGRGHSISNFYQNTWEMFGDYNDGYSGKPNHYKDAMGLFGYVLNGTVKNLTVCNFSSDGEFTPTGCIAAYADGNSTFENIAIVGCNPRVYNTGNGGIIGIAGDTNAANDDHITLTNITVDNSNKISALWGSWDVACGGLVGMYRGNVDASGNATGDTISFNNCHVSAQIDVYNDVCANYQYYAYRYSGMIIGSVRHNTTNEDGKTIPNMTGISASGCTVNYGDWNDYYYCEFEKNSMASYSEDYQFSRVPHSELIFTDSNGNGVVDADERASVTGCNHTHTAEENHQAIYLPFHQLFTGYSWGVSSIGLEKYSGIITNLGITEGDQEESVEKFDSVLNANSAALEANKLYRIGDLFTNVESPVGINGAAVRVAVSALDGNGITAQFVANESNWTQGTLTFDSIEGLCSVTIQDYNFCKPTTIILNNGKLHSVFASNFNQDFRYRVGNQNAISLGTLFTENGVEIHDSNVKVTLSRGTDTYTADATEWQKGTIDFGDTGIATITIQDENYCNVTELTVEVVDAVNATSATWATGNNVVLLQDCGFSSLEVSGGYTLYGNGFTMTCASDSAALDMGYSFVTLSGGTLDNVQIVCPNFDYAVLYKSNMTESGNRSETTDRTRYFNVKSGVMVSGNSQILNSRISGGRAAVNVSGGNCVIDNSRIELGAVASILVGGANSLTLRDVTLVQKPTASTHDPSKTLMGFSVLMVCNDEGNAAPVTLEGTLIQNAWVDEQDKQYVPSAGKSIISTVLAKTDYLHDIDGDGKNESLNLGFAYMPESLTSKVNTTTITDNRTNKDTVPYDYAEVSILNGKTYVYSYKNTNGTDADIKEEDAYVPDAYGDIITVSYSDTAEGLTTSKSFSTAGWVYELNVDLDKLPGYALDFSKLSMTVNGVAVTDFKVNGNAKPTTPVEVVAGGTTYTLTTTTDDKEYTAFYKVTGTETSKESPTLVASNYEAGLCVASSYGGTWHGAAPALEGIQIKYWSVAEKQYKTITLSDYTPTTAGKQNGTNTTWTYSPANGDFTLTLTGGQVHSSNNVYAVPVVCDGKLYFVAASSSGLVNSGNSARTIPVSYSFKDNNNGDVLNFSHTWSVAENKDAQYKYSDFCNGTLTKLEASSGGGGCVTPDTLITLGDGTQVRVDSLTGKEELLVWNMETGKLDSAPIMFVDQDPVAGMEVIHLYFSDGTDVKVIYEHGFWDYDLNRYVYLDQNAQQYIGHTFAKQNGSSLAKVKLTKVVLETEMTSAWSPVTAGHLCYFVNGMLSMPGGVGGLFNIFEVDPETMTYDLEAMHRDIQTYGLFTYEEMNEIAPLTEEMFNAAGGAYLKVSIGKGNLTVEELIAMINRYSKYI